MPLIRGRPIKQQTYKRLNDDEEVFYCELTNEIFENYEEYCERIISCSCCIWSCAITGKSGLTYQEALESEEKALQNIKDFAPELRTPVLYLASLTAVSHFSEMADIVYHFVKNRYFVGESVQACFSGDQWSYAQVIDVMLPTPDEVIAYCTKTGAKHPLQHRPYPAELYKYKVEEVLDEEPDDDDECSIIRSATLLSENVRRVKGLYTKDKNRAYLKQFTEQTKNGTWNVKSAILNKYGISTVNFSDIFVGEPPVLDKVSLSTPPSSKLKQSSIKKFAVSSPSFTHSSEKSPKKNVSTEVAKKIQKKYAESSKDEVRSKQLEMLRKKKEAQRQEKEQLEVFAKEWQRKREDLECEDLKELPVPYPVECRVPNHLFGDFVMILEFLGSFKDILNVKDYFPYGLSFEHLQRALMDVEVAGPFSDILQLLLRVVFRLQEEEEDEVRQGAVFTLNESSDLTPSEALRAATQAAHWSNTFQNLPLSKLHMDAITVTEILRLHLLSSGGRAGDHSAKWRLQERGGYMSTDDPGLEFRLKEPEILKFLATNCVAGLPTVDKLKILSCLMNQILTYASVRDVIDERFEKVATGRKDLKTEQVTETKKDKERLKKAREAKSQGNSRASLEERQKLSADIKLRQEKHQRRLMELREIAMGYQVMPLGQDRAYRRYWVFNSLPGLYVEDNEEYPGCCLPQPTAVNPSHADEDDTMNYIRKLFEASRIGTGSDKENEGDEINFKTHVNGLDHKSPLKVSENRPLICTANNATCSIHNRSIERTRWNFFSKEEEIDELIKNLNKRGHRESALRDTLESEKERILNHLEKCPSHKLNPNSHGRMLGTRSMKGYDDANLKYPAGTPIDVILEMYLRDVILDTEEKITAGALGTLKVLDRKAWREAIEARSYDCQDDYLTWPTQMNNSVKKNDEEDSRPVSPFSDVGDDSLPLGQFCQQTSVKDLAMAVLQLARSVEPKFFQKPLLYEDKKPVALTKLQRWEFSLMRSTSFSQVYLHISTLESSIQWNKSVLNMRCKICRRGKDDVNMLLCDGCDRGFHLYCLKPKLTAIPRGDWFCPSCRPKEQTPVKRSYSRRRLLEEEEAADSDDEPLSAPIQKRRRDSDDSWEPVKRNRL